MTTKTYSLLFSLFILLAILPYILLSGCADLSPANQPQSAAASGSVTISDENGNRVVLETDRDNQALIQIFSEPGLGVTDINIANATYPDKITMRLHLRGLEELSIRYAGNTHIVSILSIGDSMGNSTIRQSAIDTSGERSLAPDAQEWLDVELVDMQAQAASTQPAIPLEDGYIDVTLPQLFIDEQIRDFSIEWVDFFR